MRYPRTVTSATRRPSRLGMLADSSVTDGSFSTVNVYRSANRILPLTVRRHGSWSAGAKFKYRTNPSLDWIFSCGPIAQASRSNTRTMPPSSTTGASDTSATLGRSSNWLIPNSAMHPRKITQKPIPHPLPGLVDLLIWTRFHRV